MLMCEFCSETFPKSKMMLHIYSIHYDQWAGNTKERFSRVKSSLEEKVQIGPYYKFLVSNYVPCNDQLGDEDEGMDCKICFVSVQKASLSK